MRMRFASHSKMRLRLSSISAFIVVVVGMVEEMEERKVKKLVVEEMKRVAGQGGRLGGWLGAAVYSWRRKKK